MQASTIFCMAAARTYATRLHCRVAGASGRSLLLVAIGL